MFLWIIERFLQFCDWFGLSTEYFNQNGSSVYYKRRAIVLFILHLLNAIVLSVGMCYTMFSRVFKFNAADFANDMSKVIGLSIVYFLAIIEAMLVRDRQRKMWQLYAHIRTTQPSHPFRQSSIDRFACELILFFSLFAFHELASIKPALILSQRITMVLVRWLCDLLLFTMHQIRLFHYILYVHLLTDELNAIEGKLNRIVCEFNKDPSDTSVLCSELTSVRQHHNLVYFFTEHLNGIFGWSQMAGIVNCFVGVATSFNFIYGSFEQFQKVDTFGMISGFQSLDRFMRVNFKNIF